MIDNNPTLDLVNINAHEEFGQILSICSICLKILRRNEILTIIKGYNSITNLCKMMCNNPNLDLVRSNAYTKFGQILLIYSPDIEWK